MRRLRALPMIALLLVCGTPLVSGAQTLKGPRIVLTDKDAFGILPHEVISGPVVKRMTVSDDGRNVVVLREKMRFVTPPPSEPTIEKNLIFWESKGRTPVTIWKAEGRGTSLSEVEFLPQTDTAFVLVRQEAPPAAPGGVHTFRTVLLRITPQFDRAQEIDLTSGEDQFTLDISPAQPLALLRRVQHEMQEVTQPDGTKMQILRPICAFHVMRKNGRPGPAIPLPKAFGHSDTEWTPEGNPIIRCVEIPADGGRAKLKWFALDTQQNKLTPLDKEPPQYKGPSALEAQAAKLSLRLKPSRATAQEGETTESLSLLWLESKEKTESPRVLLTAEAAEGVLLPRGDGVLYKAQESLLFAPLFRMDKQAYELARRASDRAVAMSNAKQLGLGLMMYAQDYDETFPTGEDINEKISPYLKNNELFRGFNYTYGGGKLSDIPNTAETILGHVLGPGGRAIIYVDGHVKWEND
jgi:hypothetical protein